MAKPLAAARPRLRFDKVAQRLIRRLEDALRDVIPDGTTVIVTVTAPIRLPAKTCTSLEETIATLLVQGTRLDHEAAMHGNQIRVRIVASRTGAPKLIGYVHNPDPGAQEILLDETEAQLRAGAIW